MKGFRNPNAILEEIPESERMNNKSQNEDEEADALDDDDGGIPFTQRMRIETRKIHNISDHLVNAKLGLAMSDDKIWAEGLLIFYEIFKFLEAAMIRLAPRNEPLKRMQKIIAGIERTVPFEQDLEFYYGPEYLRNYEMKPAVRQYLKHLEILEEREPLRLLAYIYHLYMGLLSGGQILKKKRDFRNRLKQNVWGCFHWFGLMIPTTPQTDPNTTLGGRTMKGEAVTYFGDGRSISDIKKEIVFTLNDIVSDFSRDEKNSILEESILVFKQNNEIVASIKRTGIAALKNYAACLFILLTIGSAMYFYWTRAQEE